MPDTELAHMDRRSFLKLAALASLAPAMIVDALHASHPASARRCN
jgi:hypothetical protein